MTRTSLVALGTALTLAACGDGQTESGYRGEPLMSLRGVVTSSESALSEDLVPALIFISYDEVRRNQSITDITTYYVMSEVEGTFPSSFTMRIYEPPPDAALLPSLEGEPEFTFGQITAVSPEHPRSLQKQSYVEPIEGIPDGEILREELCSDTGVCTDGYPAKCPEGLQDPSREWPCGATFADLPWESYGYSERYSVVYFAGDVAADSVLSKIFGTGAAIASGYHAVRFTDPMTLPADEQQARSECLADASKQAVDVLGEMGITEPFNDIDKQIQFNHQTMIAEAELGCQPVWHVIADPVSEPIELPFTDQPMRSTF